MKIRLSDVLLASAIALTSVSAWAKPEITFVTTGIDVAGENTGVMTGEFPLISSFAAPVTMDFQLM